jgi:hypothetical protein
MSHHAAHLGPSSKIFIVMVALIAKLQHHTIQGLLQIGRDHEDHLVHQALIEQTVQQTASQK